MDSSGALVEEDDDDDDDCEETKLLLEEFRDEKVNQTSETGSEFYGFGNFYSNMFGQHHVSKNLFKQPLYS